MDTLDLDAFREEAEALDVTDPAPMADRFEFPPAHVTGSPFATRAYFAGNSLGLLPKATRSTVGQVLESWSINAVEGHFTGAHPWTTQAELLVEPLARIVGAYGHEVIAANTLTVNVHLLLLAFYRPSGTGRSCSPRKVHSPPTATRRQATPACTGSTWRARS